MIVSTAKQYFVYSSLDLEVKYSKLFSFTDQCDISTSKALSVDNMILRNDTDNDVPFLSLNDEVEKETDTTVKAM